MDAVGAVIRRGAVDVVEDAADGKTWEGDPPLKAGLNYRSRSRRGKRVAWVVVDAVGAVIRRGAVDVVEDAADGKTWEGILRGRLDQTTVVAAGGGRGRRGEAGRRGLLLLPELTVGDAAAGKGHRRRTSWRPWTSRGPWTPIQLDQISSD